MGLTPPPCLNDVKKTRQFGIGERPLPKVLAKNIDLPVLSHPVLFYRTQSAQQARFVSQKFDSTMI